MPTLNQVITKTKSEKSVNAKNSLNDFILKIDKRLEKYFDHEIKYAFGVSAKERALAVHILKHIKEHNLRPAKRIRGSFVYWGYRLKKNDKEKQILDAAMSIELIHTALLMHDDFMDQDDTRRGLPTTHEFYKSFHQTEGYCFDPTHYGNSMAVAVGDIALLSGYEILGKSDFKDSYKIAAMNKTLRGVVNTGIGQAYDITLEARGSANEKDIIDLHYAKTAIYTYENPLQIGAILTGASNSDLEILSKYAIPGGIAFQLQDDILGLFGNTDKTGKPAHSDLRQGKMTLLIIKALKNGTKKQVRQLKQIWGKRTLTEKEANEARKIIIETGSLDYSKQISVKWAKKAQEAIALMCKNKWNKKAINYLDGIAQYMVERET